MVPRRFVQSTGAPKPRRDRGQALAEFAIIVPVFLFLLLIAIDFGRLFYTYIDVHNGAREGAAYAGSAPSDTAGITTHVTNETIGQAQRGAGAATVSVSCSTAMGGALPCVDATGGGGAGETVTVNVSRPFTFLTPLIGTFFGGPLNLGASASANVFGYAGGDGESPPGPCSAPTADFSVILTGGRSIFVDPSASRPNSGICNISGYNWTWGDTLDDVGTATGDSHTYLNDGTYVVTLKVTNQGGESSKSQTVTIGAPPPPPTCTKPSANFSWTATGSGANKTYTYSDASTVADAINCPITDWLWTFTDKGTQSNAQNPAPFQYGNNSSHPVTLKVTNSAGFSTITKSS